LDEFGIQALTVPSTKCSDTKGEAPIAACSIFVHDSYPHGAAAVPTLLARFHLTVDDTLYCLSKSTSFVAEKPVDSEGFQKTVSAIESNYIPLMERRVTDVAYIFDRDDESLPRCNEDDLLEGLDFHSEWIGHDPVAGIESESRP
jgi:hypothetical protein